MPITKYVTRKFSPDIEVVQVVRETVQSVFIARGGENVDRVLKVTDWSVYHDTWGAAHQFLIGRYTGAIASLRDRLEGCQRLLDLVEAMKCPDAD